MLYTATNTTFTNRTRHEGQLPLGTNLHILENTAAGVTAMVALGNGHAYVGQVRSSIVK
ncbi:MAG: hypothetical protein WBC51_02465 [Vicinamibacterales bacterium]